ncbi:MAG TPA: hypothetical protein G4O13_06425 [Dehalococcoidia bacterium]|nr:hypothetical protein [Dehalococcoidia bacterium]
MMLPAAKMLKHLGEEKAASNLESTIVSIIFRGNLFVHDIKLSPMTPNSTGRYLQ